jgi:glycosyltransferase involved in cell wall biosynthesis
MENVFYFKHINTVGGCESFFWYLSKKYDFKIYYKEADPKQIKRLSQNVECHKYKDIIKCDKFFCNYGLDIEVDAKEKYHIIHCDYKNVWFAPIQYDGFKYIGVSKLVCDSFKELTNKNAELIYNPIYLDSYKKEKYNDNKIHLISATRLTREKGLERMKKLASILEKNKIDYIWEVYTNKKRELIGNNVVYKKHKLDIINEIAKADYLVQLSDCEAFCYSVVEALTVGTKVICTDLPVYKELGLNKENAIIYDLNMKNVNIEDIKKEYKFKYNPPKENWSKYLSMKKNYNPNELVEVKVIKDYTDMELNKKLKKDDIEKMTKQRASYLEAKELVEW